jgi:hypothetical protein
MNQKTLIYELPQYEIINKTNNFETSNLRTTNGILKNNNNSTHNTIPTTNNNNNNKCYNNIGENHNVKFLPGNVKYEIVKHDSENEDDQDAENASTANALLYEKLMNLVSDSSIDLSNEQMSVQINRLLSNPNIKHQLKQLHSQLLANPSHYLPQLENILLSGSSSNSVDLPNNANNLFNLRPFFSNNNDVMKNHLVTNNKHERCLPINLEINQNNNNNNSINATTNSINNNSNNQLHPTARIISRDLKL